MISVGQLVEDLKKLRQGLGLDTPGLSKNITERLRLVLELDGDDAAVRDQLKQKIAELAEPLREEHRQAVLIAYGLTGDRKARTLKQRVALLAKLIDRSERSATRRIDEALSLVAQHALSRKRASASDGSTPLSPWRTISLRTTVVLDKDLPEVYEVRRIAASTDGLAEVELELTVDAPPHWTEADPSNPTVDVLHGGTLHTRSRHSRTRIGYVLALPRTLARDEEHEFFLRFRFTAPGAMEPFYMCTPKFLCSLFDLHIRFGRERVPDKIWKVHGSLINEVLDHSAPRQQVEADTAGEVHLTFTGLVPNLSSGAVWTD
ncbi:hypothetical protein ACIQMJ_40355 [Actinosynnema sp. NPDC091369]